MQYQQLADKYAPTAPEVADTLANLQVPPDDHKLASPIPSSYVPLPKRGQAGCNQHQIALLIRDGRRAAQQLATSHTTEGSVGGRGNGDSGGGGSSKETSSGTAITTMSIIMEQDFTVEGKKGVLDCPFSVMKRRQQLLRQQQQLEQENQQLHITGGSAHGDLDVDHDGADTADIVAAAAPPGTQSPNGAGGDDPGTTNEDGADGTGTHPAEDPICAALAEESTSQHGGTSSGGAAPRCPIRFLDQHSPEEVAHYVETHKHQLPRSHAICLKRYNKDEVQTRKMDAKYGNLVNMISGLGQFHQPMLASAEPGTAGAEGGGGGGGRVVLGVGEHEEEEVDRVTLHKDSHERVTTWANGVSASSEDADGEDNGNSGGRDDADDEGEGADLRGRRRSLAYSGGRESSGSGGDNTEPERESHFDRPLKEVRLGESPSRPWGIAVPISSMPLDAAAQPPLSPPAAPVRMPSPLRASPAARGPPVSPSKAQPARKCPFDHSKFGLGISPPPGHAPVEPEEREDREEAAETPAETTPRVDDGPDKTVQTDRPFSPMKPQQPEAQAQPQQTFTQPAFVNFPPQTTAPAGAGAGAGADVKAATGPVPQMLFTGPVFIGFPMEQAAQFLQMYHNPQGR